MQSTKIRPVQRNTTVETFGSGISICCNQVILGVFFYVTLSLRNPMVEQPQAFIPPSAAGGPRRCQSPISSFLRNSTPLGAPPLISRVLISVWEVRIFFFNFFFSADLFLYFSNNFFFFPRIGYVWVLEEIWIDKKLIKSPFVRNWFCKPKPGDFTHWSCCEFNFYGVNIVSDLEGMDFSGIESLHTLKREVGTSVFFSEGIFGNSLF